MKDIFLWVILPLALAEIIMIGPWLSARLLRWGAHGLPEQYQELYTDDWLGELDMVPGSLTKLAFAIRILVRVPATQRALTGRDAIWTLAVKRCLVLLVGGLLFALQLVLRLGGRLTERRMEAALRRRNEELRVPREREIDQATLAAVQTARTRASQQFYSVVRLPFWKSFTPLNETSMSPRTVRILSDAGIRTCGQLLDRYEGKGERGWGRDLGTREWEETRLVVQTLINARYRSRRRILHAAIVAAS